MTIKGHILRTASEIAMGRYMRAPDHPGQAAADEFAAAFDDLSKEDAAPAAGADKGGAGDGSSGDAAAGGPAAGADAGGDGAAGAEGGAGGDAGGAAGAASAEGASGDAGAGDAGKGDKDAGGAAAEAAPADGADKGGAAGKDGAGAGKSKKGKEPAAAAPAAETDDVLNRLAAAVAAQGGKKEEPAAAAPAAVEEEPILTQEEIGKIDAFKKDWPDVAEAFELQAKVHAHSILKYAFSQIGEQFIPLREMVEALATRTHYGDLKEKVGEYTEAERGEIIDWVKEQPTYLQTAMMSVIQEGTAEEVADLVGRYREATGKQPAGAQAAEAAAPGGETELSDEAKKAAAALAPVSSKRSDVQAQEDTSDFDGAFAKFADVL